jgi:hypothetical protein
MRGLDLVQFRRVDVDMDDLRLRAETSHFAGCTIIETRADGDQQIALVKREIGKTRTVHAKHAERQRMLERHGTEGHQSHHRRQSSFFGQRHSRCGCSRMHDATAEVENRPRGLVDHRRSKGDPFRRRRWNDLGDADSGPLADLDHLILHVLRNIDQYRSRATRSGDPESARDDFEQVLRTINQEVMFGNRDAQAIGIDLLEGVGTDHRSRHLPGDRHQRNRIQLGVGNRRQQIRCPGARRSHAYRRQAGGTRNPLRHEAAALFVPCQHVVNQRRLRQSIVNGQYCAAGNTGQGAHALSFEQAHDNLCSAEGFGSLLGQGTLLN